MHVLKTLGDLSMKLSKIILAGLVCSAPFVNASAAAEFQFYVVPLSGLTGISQSANEKSVGNAPKYSGMIDAKFADIIFDSDSQKKIKTRFLNNTLKAFPTSVIGPSQVVEDGKSGSYKYENYDSVGCRPSFSAPYKDTFVISIGVSRLSVYFNDFSSLGSDFSQVIIPVTYTIRLIKLDGASVILSHSETITSQYKTTTKELYLNKDSKEIKPEILAKIKSAIIDTDSGKIIDGLVDYAVKNFNPKVTEATVIFNDGKYVAFDKGSEIGFITGEVPEVDNKDYYGFDVKYTTDGLAIAVAEESFPENKTRISRLRVGDKLKFVFSKQGVDDAKPSVLAVQYAIDKPDQKLTKEQILSNSLISIVSDNLGSKLPFNLLKEDPDFVRLKNGIQAEINCSSTMWPKVNGFSAANTTRRKDPDLFLKLDSLVSPVFTAVSETGVTSTEFFKTNVGLALIDRSNFIRQRFAGADSYENTTTDGKGLSFPQAMEVSLKNASLVASKALTDGFFLPVKTVKINSINDGKVTLAESIPSEMLNESNLVRPMQIGKKNILLPIPKKNSSLQSLSPDSSNTFNLVNDQFANKSDLVTSSDVLRLSGEIVAGKKIVKYCDLSKKRSYLTPPLIDSSNAELTATLSSVLIAKNYQMQQTDPDFNRAASSALNLGYYESDKLKDATDTNMCIIPFEVMKLSKNDCKNNKCEGSADITVGVRVYVDGKKTIEIPSAVNASFKDILPSQVSPFVGLKAFDYHLQLVKDVAAKL